MRSLAVMRVQITRNPSIGLGMIGGRAILPILLGG
jgi:hypothetical protein